MQLEDDMHGVIMAELEKVILDKGGWELWSEIRIRARAGGRSYLATRNYPNREFMELLRSASEVLDVHRVKLLEDLGFSLAPTLSRLYRGLVDPKWRTLDLLEHASERIHRAIRARDPRACPPPLDVQRWGSDELVITYSSPLKLCALAKGLIRGIANLYGDQVLVAEGLCMTHGAAQCEISTKLLVSCERSGIAEARL